MTNSTSSQPSNTATSTPARHGAVRRAIAGVAAAAIALGGVGMLSPTEASAAGVKPQTYVVAPADVQVQTVTTGTPKSKN